MQRILAAALFALFAFVSPSFAQSNSVVPLPSGCGTGNITNSSGYLTEGTDGTLCVNATVNASISGFTPNNNFATLSANGISASILLPSGSTVAFQNTGTSTVSCSLGVGSATAIAGQIQVPASSTVFVTPGSNTWGACIDQTGSSPNTVVLAGGSGLGAGFGGGGGGGGGGGLSVTDTAAFTAGSSPLTPSGGFYQTTATSNPLTSGQQGMAQLTQFRAVMSNLRTAAGAEAGVAASPFIVGQATAANLNATVVGTGTFAVQAASTLNAETTKVIGTVRTLGNAGAIADFVGYNAASPANAWWVGGQYQASPGAITNGNSAPLQLDSTGNLKVNIVTGSTSGTVAQGLPTSGQFGMLIQGATTTGAPTYTTADTNPLSLTTTGQLRVQDNLASGSVVSGAFASGSIASGAISSGAIASGAISSGAVASGAVASGAFASGSIGSGAMVDLGSQADAACGTATGSCSLIALTKYFNSTVTNPTTGLAATAYNTNSYSNAATSSFNTDLNGNLFVNAQISRWGGTALGAPSNYGTSPGAVVVPGVNAFVTNTVNTIGTTTTPTAAGATPTTAVPTSAYNLGYNGTTWDALQVDASKYLKINCVTGCAGGTFNNNADAVATSSTNGQAAAWLYGFNGTTWDRLQVDSNKYLKVDTTAIGGSALALGSTTASASIPVVIASNQTAGDPCSSFQAKSFADFASTTSGGSIITAVSAKKAYICSIAIVSSTAANVSLIEGTGSSVCTGGTPAGVYLNPGVTAANGAAVSANSGVAASGGGTTIAANATVNQNICVLFTTTNTPQVNVHVSYVMQ